MNERPCPHCQQTLTPVGPFWICPQHGQVALETRVVPLRIFLSYGHDSNVELVRRIKSDLEQRGHHVWLDHSAIKGGHDWRRAITEGIVDSHQVVSFLSKHSTRDPGVCLDEIAIAIGVQGGNIQTILVESEQEVRPPPSLSHIQWLDMHDWQAQHAAGAAVWEPWYQGKLADIVRVVESDTSRHFAGEITTLAASLKPLSADARLFPLLKKGLVGRAWVVEAMEQWRQAADRTSRLFWILGAPGVGKSAFAAHIAHYGRDKVLAVQFCAYDQPEHRNAHRIVRTLAFQIATRLPDYRKLLLTLPEIAALDQKHPAELFDYLLANPLRHALDGGRERYLIVIDALDEAGGPGGNALVDMLARHAPHLPDWVGLVITSRPERDVIAPLQSLHPFLLDTATEANRADLRAYLQRELASHLEHHPDAERLVEHILDKSEGVFLYVERVCDDLQHGHRSLEHPEALPQGLGGIFFQYFQRQFPDRQAFAEHIHPLLNLLVARREPLPWTVLTGALGISDFELRKRLAQLGSLFPVDRRQETTGLHETLAPFHKAVDEWLTAIDPRTGFSLAGDYAADRDAGEHALARYGLESCYHQERPPLPYFLRHLCAHLLAAGHVHEATGLLLDLPWLEAKVGAGLAFELPGDFAAVLRAGEPGQEGHLLLLLVDEALRTDLNFIASSASEYPQGLMQSVLNYLLPITSPAPGGAPDLGISQAVAGQLQTLLAQWEEQTRQAGRGWIKLHWVDRARVLLGPLRWQAPMRDRPPQHLAFSPSGEALAAAAGWPYANRPAPPSPWPHAYDIAVWSTATGALIDRLFPAAASVPFNGPPEHIPRPPEVEQHFVEYFAYQAQQRSRPAAPLDFRRLFMDDPDPVTEAERLEQRLNWNIGAGWGETLLAGDVQALCWLSDTVVLVGARGGRIFGWDVRSSTQIIMIQETNVDPALEIRLWGDTSIRCLVQIAPSVVAAGTSFGSVDLIDLQEPESRRRRVVLTPAGTFVATRNRVWALAWHEPSGRLALGASDHTVRVIDVHSLQQVCQLSGHTDYVTGVAWSPCGTRLASVSFDKTLRLWDMTTQQEVCPPTEHPMDVLAVAWGLADDEVLTTWNQNGVGGSVRTWHAATGELRGEFGAVPALLESMAALRARGLVATGSKDGYVRVYAPARPGMAVRSPHAHAGGIRDAAFCVARNEVATLGLDGLYTWSARDGTRLNAYPCNWHDYVNWTFQVQYAHHGRRLVAVIGNVISMFDTEHLTLMWSRSAGIANSRDVTRCYFAADSQRFLTDDSRAPHAAFMDTGSGALVWDVETGALVDRSGDDGADAESRLHSYEAAVVAREDPSDAHDAPPDVRSAAWHSGMVEAAKTGITRVRVVDSMGRTHHFTMAGVVQHRFPLAVCGEWVVILKGATAPSKASVIWPPA